MNGKNGEFGIIGLSSGLPKGSVGTFSRKFKYQAGEEKVLSRGLTWNYKRRV